MSRTLAAPVNVSRMFEALCKPDSPQPVIWRRADSCSSGGRGANGERPRAARSAVAGSGGRIVGIGYMAGILVKMSLRLRSHALENGVGNVFVLRFLGIMISNSFVDFVQKSRKMSSSGNCEIP